MQKLNKFRQRGYKNDHITASRHDLQTIKVFILHHKINTIFQNFNNISFFQCNIRFIKKYTVL